MHARPHDIRKFGVLLLAASLAQACVDPEARYEDFIDRTSAMRGKVPDAGPTKPTDRFDWTGHYLLALSTVLGPDQPLLFGADAEVAEDLTRINLKLQPLTTSQDSEPRTPVGDPLSLSDIPYDEDGSFSADLGEVTVPGRANPITGSNIVAQVRLQASTRMASGDASQLFCGEVSGMLTQPLAFDLAGSTFAAVLTEDDKSAMPALRCP